MEKQILICHKRPILKAIDTLIQYYRGKITLDCCPFCLMWKGIWQKNVDSGCQLCPWLWFADEFCDTFAWRLAHQSAAALRTHRDSQWVEFRLKQLRQWKRKVRDL